MTWNMGSASSYERNAFRKMRNEQPSFGKKEFVILDLAEAIARKRAMKKAQIAC